MRHLNLVSIGIIGLFLVSSCSDVVHRVGTVDFKQSYDLKHKGNGTEIMSDGGPLFVIDTLVLGMGRGNSCNLHIAMFMVVPSG